VNGIMVPVFEVTNEHKQLVTFQDWVNKVFVDLAPPSYDLYKNEVIHVQSYTDAKGEVGYQFALKLDNVHKVTTGLGLLMMYQKGTPKRPMTRTDAWTLFMLQHLAGQGIKAFRPTVTECEALENCEPRVPCTEYEQPFDVYAIELPKDYSSRRLTPGKLLDDSPIDVMPLAVVALHAKAAKAVAVFVILHSGQTLVHTFGVHSDTDTLADELKHTYGMAMSSSIDVTEEEKKLMLYGCNLAVNTSLLLTQYGCKRVGSTNGHRESRLRRYLQGKPNQYTTANQIELNSIPVVYGFDQHIKIYDEAREPVEKEAGEGSGVVLKPHWRRGHWAMLACGEGRKERKKHFRKAVLINPHLLGGPEYNTRVTMTTGNKS